MTTPRRRVACSVLRGRELLVFDHVDHPDAGTQVPAGGQDEFLDRLTRERPSRPTT